MRVRPSSPLALPAALALVLTFAGGAVAETPLAGDWQVVGGDGDGLYLGTARFVAGPVRVRAVRALRGAERAGPLALRAAGRALRSVRVGRRAGDAMAIAAASPGPWPGPRAAARRCS